MSHLVFNMGHICKRQPLTSVCAAKTTATHGRRCNHRCQNQLASPPLPQALQESLGFFCCSLSTAISISTWLPLTTTLLAFRQLFPHVSCFFRRILCVCFSDDQLPLPTPCEMQAYLEPLPWAAATLGGCPDSYWGFYCCCHHQTLSTHSYTPAAAAILSQAAHHLCSPLRHTTQQQTVSHFTTISSRFGNTIGNS